MEINLKLLFIALIGLSFSSGKRICQLLLNEKSLKPVKDLQLKEKRFQENFLQIFLVLSDRQQFYQKVFVALLMSCQ